MHRNAFVILYRWEIRSGHAEAFRDSWERLTLLYSQLYGATGGRLHRAEGDLWIAYSEWPSRDQYFMAVERGVPDEAIAESMNAAVLRRLDPVFMELQSDLLDTAPEP